ncbi:sugar transferase [Nocardioides caricicola]|uniref:Sugar transferase n=1 Tax=Nocardioides caricicola TaxID=634770 RepID=A0ABW0MY19_9ACTN
MTEPAGSRRPERWVAAALLAVSAPALAAGALAVRLSSPGPVIYRASRAGRDATDFTMYKLRTMHLGEGGPITGGRDPRIFPAGVWLRRLKVDELPQLWNVLRGEMKFFGPRPEDPAIVRDHYAPWMHETLTVPPGIVGPGSLGYFLEESELAQDPEAAFTQYVDELLPRKLARDLVYLRAPSRRYRLQLLARTALGVIGRQSWMSRYESEERRRADEILRSVASS